MIKEDIDYDILKTFIPLDDLEYFLVWDNVYIYDDRIQTAYRLYTNTKYMSLPISGYQSRVRELKLNTILK